MYMTLYARDLSPSWKLFIIVVYLLVGFYLMGNVLAVTKMPQYEVVTPITTNNVSEVVIENG